jgi:polysaccharide export outer membrane protein
MRPRSCAIRSSLARARWAAVWITVAVAPAAAAQTTEGSGLLLATRESLERRAAELEGVEGPGGRGGRALTQPAVAELTALRRRLADGDFGVGDRVVLFVEGEAELSDTFAVSPARELVLPVVGPVTLRGVLRSELELRLAGEVARFVRDPNVRATALIMVSITGDVATPGFYAMPVTALVADVVMAAGGGTRDAKVQDLRVERDGETIWNSGGLARAVREGRTLDELGLKSGDLFVMPGRNRTGTESTLRTVSLLLSIPLTVYALTRVF